MVGLLFFYNNIRRMLFYYLVQVITYDEEDDEGGKQVSTEDGECGREEVCHTIDETVSCPVFQEGVEENYEGRADDGGDADEPQIEATEEQGDVSSLGAVNLTECYFLLSRTGVEGNGAPDAHEADDEADAGEYPRGITHDFDEEDFVVERIAQVCHTLLQGFWIDALHGLGEVGKDAVVSTLLGLDNNLGHLLVAPVAQVYHLVPLRKAGLIRIRPSGERATDAQRLPVDRQEPTIGI